MIFVFAVTRGRAMTAMLPAPSISDTAPQRLLQRPLRGGRRDGAPCAPPPALQRRTRTIPETCRAARASVPPSAGQPGQFQDTFALDHGGPLGGPGGGLRRSKPASARSMRGLSSGAVPRSTISRVRRKPTTSTTVVMAGMTLISTDPSASEAG